MAKKNRKVIVYTGIAAIALVMGYLSLKAIDIDLLRTLRPSPPHYPTYFTYTSDELASLRKLSSDTMMSIDDLFEWEDTLFDLVSDEKISRGQAKKMLVYLVVAQREVESQEVV